jgi:hypothetical protein
VIRAAALVLLASCGGPEPLASCTDDLGGAWRSESGERWMILDSRRTLEAFPLFDDTKLPGVTHEIGARAIDLARQRGQVSRRFTSAGTSCVEKAPAHLVSCAGDKLELVLADPSPPISYATCASGSPPPSHRERWTRD